MLGCVMSVLAQAVVSPSRQEQQADVYGPATRPQTLIGMHVLERFKAQELRRCGRDADHWSIAVQYYGPVAS